MTPLSAAHTELRLLVAQLEVHATALRAQPVPAGLYAMRWEDHRTHSLALLWEALDRIEPDLGTRFICTQHAEPFADVVAATEAAAKWVAT